LEFSTGVCCIAQTRFETQSSLLENNTFQPWQHLLLERGLLMIPHQPRDWKCLAEQASKEMDSDKLLGLVTELNRVLREHEEGIQWQQREWNKP
jgi:hypothetical protein